MELRVLEQEKGENKLSFMVKDTTPSFVNALRRIMLEEVPTMAIEEVSISKNNSILYDEMIAHRLGLLPLTTDLKSYEQADDLADMEKLSAKNYVTLVLSAKGPGIVYASELKSKDPAVKPVYPKMPIVKLLKGQALELEAKAVLGNGRMHTKWSPCLAYYKQKPNVEIGNVDNPEKIVEATHGNIVEIKNGKLEVIKDNLFKYDMAGVLEEASEGKIKVTYDNDFIFHVESWGQLSCKEILNEALDIYNQNYDDFVSALKKAE